MKNQLKIFFASLLMMGVLAGCHSSDVDELTIEDDPLGKERVRDTGGGDGGDPM
ncbi:MAG: hypothetical protein AAGA66_02520 [Bacteroidota bacterium]